MRRIFMSGHVPQEFVGVTAWIRNVGQHGMEALFSVKQLFGGVSIGRGNDVVFMRQNCVDQPPDGFVVFNDQHTWLDRAKVIPCCFLFPFSHVVNVLPKSY